MRVVLIAAVLAATPATAQTLSIGDSYARGCYEAARNESRSANSIRTCDAALEFSLNAPFDRVATLVNRGILRFHRNELSGALADYDAALSERPTQPEAMLNKGILLLRFADRVGEAKALFDGALTAGTSKPELAYLARGVAHEQAGDIRAAYRDYKQAEALVPGWRPAERELSRFQVRRMGSGPG